MSFIIIYITHKNIDEAKRVVLRLLRRKLIACADFFPIKSIFWWKDKLGESNGVVSLVKTRKENWELVKSEVESIHYYDVPCIMKMDVEFNDDYGNWINAKTVTR